MKRSFEMVHKNGTNICINFANMLESKKLMNSRSYDADFKSEILKLLVSGKKVKEISETFGIAENLLYRWKTISMMQKNKQTSSPIRCKN